MLFGLRCTKQMMKFQYTLNIEYSTINVLIAICSDTFFADKSSTLTLQRSLLRIEKSV